MDFGSFVKALKAAVVVLIYLLMPMAVLFVAPSAASLLYVSESLVIAALIVVYFLIPYAVIALYPLFKRTKVFWNKFKGGRGDEHRIDVNLSEESDPYTFLGLDNSASNEDVKRAFRAIIRRYHPDLVEKLDPVSRSIALELTKKINAAFSKIRRERGF